MVNNNSRVADDRVKTLLYKSQSIASELAPTDTVIMQSYQSSLLLLSFPEPWSRIKYSLIHIRYWLPLNSHMQLFYLLTCVHS